MSVNPFEAGQVVFEVSTRISSWSFNELTQRFLRWWSVGAHLLEEDDPEGPGERIGWAHFVVVDVRGLRDAGEHPYHAMDAESGDLETVAAVLLTSEPEEFDDYGADLELVHPLGRLLVLDRARVDPGYRGHGLGPAMVAVGLDELLPGCAVAACIPAPTEGDREGPARKTAVEKLGRLWSTVGFEPFRDDVWILDPNTRDAEEAIERVLSRLE